MTKIRKPYEKIPRSQIDTGQNSMTQQHFKQECDINFILRKYQKTGLIDHVAKHQGSYADLTDGVTFQEAINLIHDAQESFDTLPSSIRKKFNNNPQEFLDYVSDEANYDDLVAMGLANPPSSLPPSETSSSSVEDSPTPEAVE